MKDHDSKRPASGAKALVEPRRLLAAMSLLGASLGVSAAAPAEQISGSEPRSDDAAVRLAASVNTPSIRSMGWDVRVRPAVSNQVKVTTPTSGQIHIVRPVVSNQYKVRLSTGQIHIRSDQKKGYVPAVQSNQLKIKGN
jgi:hypothetical protein